MAFVIKSIHLSITRSIFPRVRKKHSKRCYCIVEIKAENHEQRHKRCSDTGKEISYQTSGSLVKEGYWFWSIAINLVNISIGNATNMVSRRFCESVKNFIYFFVTNGHLKRFNLDHM